MKGRLLVLLWCAVWQVWGAHRYELVPLGSLAGSGTRATAINERGQVAGVTALPEQDVWRAFIWEDGVMRELGTIGEDGSYASDLNEEGVAVGWVERPEGAEAVIFKESGVMNLGAGLEASYAYGISDSGRVAGAGRKAGTAGDTRLRAYELWPRAVDLQGEALLIDTPEQKAMAINSAGQILINTGGSWFRYPAHVRLLNSGQDFMASTVLWNGEGFVLNDLGEAAGTGDLKLQQGQAVLWREGTLVHLAGPPGRRGRATALNNHGQAAGDYSGGVVLGGEQRWDAMLWENGMGYNLRDLIEEGETLREARLDVADMNDAGAMALNANWFPEVSPGAPFRPAAAYLLRPVEAMALSQIVITGPENEAVFAEGEQVRVEWEKTGEIESLEVVVFSVRETRPHGGRVEIGISGAVKTNEVSVDATSITLTDLPPGPAAVMLQGREGHGVRFVSKPRYVRVIGPARLTAVRRTSNGGFRIGLEHTPETVYRLEWTRNLKDWHSMEGLSGMFTVPYFSAGMVLARAVKVADEGGREALFDFDGVVGELGAGRLRLLPVEGEAYEVDLQAGGAYESETGMGSGNYEYEVAGRQGRLTLRPSGPGAAVTFYLEYEPGYVMAPRAGQTGFYRAFREYANGRSEEIGDFNFSPVEE